ncbi:MAG: ATP-binding cassette domain-containing protein [Candidatus Methanoperedens sp.]|nr:ATP-binding cassette domain-containing protein [Candidatus Methanoperedens sp.]MCE8425293.1 ATP-binding cassette domain-containing protein [Candidatus Methanoperedens sp.]MCE8427814.1 ATP-binding cassette domain-containing protein [Candidatus Methanoperedens sp.]
MMILTNSQQIHIKHAWHASTADTKELIHVDCASHIYPDGSQGIHDMCFRVFEKEIVALCGPNGSGKSTLIEHLNGLLRPSSGNVTVMGNKLDLSRVDIWKDVGVVFQRSDDQLFAPTVLDDVMFGPINMGVSMEQAKSEALGALKAVGAENLSDKMPGYLSGGQKRLVCIAGVLAMKPRVIAMDEPTSDLDPLHAEMVENIILNLKNNHGISIVIATHDLDLAARISDRVCIVKDGSIITEGRPSSIFYDKNLIEMSGLRQPKVVQIYEGITKNLGIVMENYPITADELVKTIAPMIRQH